MDRKHHEVECTCSALRMASRRLTQAYDAALAAEGLRVSQYAVLSVLAKWGDYVPTMQELAERLALDRTTLGHNLGPLARDGFVDDPRATPTIAARDGSFSPRSGVRSASLPAALAQCAGSLR